MATSVYSQPDKDQLLMRQLSKSYAAPQQVKYLHLQAEIEALLQQIQSAKSQSS